MKITATRYHDISVGHTVLGHEGKCKNLHGHNYRVWFHCRPANNRFLDDVGRVLDFSVIKSKLCMWLEDNWDHKFLVYAKDPRVIVLVNLDPTVIVVPFNPTAENLAGHLLKIVCPAQLQGTQVEVVKVVIEETAKCHAAAEL